MFPPWFLGAQKKPGLDRVNKQKLSSIHEVCLFFFFFISTKPC